MAGAGLTSGILVEFCNLYQAMGSKIADLEPSLRKQLSDLADQIRASESNLLILKEGYLKVQGALEVLEIMKNQKEDDDSGDESLAIAEI